MKNIIFFVLYVIFNPRLFKPFLDGIYLPVYIQFEWLKNYKIGSVIDVGAYKGRVSLTLNYLFPDALIYAFEPTEEISELEVKNQKNIIIERLAVGDKIGSFDLNRTVYGPASSLLPFGRFYQGTFEVAEKMKVEMTTLDRYFKGKRIKKPILLKIDTQGTEGAVLRGAEKLLKDIAIIHIESPIKELYKGQDFFEDSYLFLTKRGFRYIGDISDSLFYPNFSPPEVVNCIYINTKLLGRLT